MTLDRKLFNFDIGFPFPGWLDVDHLTTAALLSSTVKPLVKSYHIGMILAHNPVISAAVRLKISSLLENTPEERALSLEFGLILRSGQVYSRLTRKSPTASAKAADCSWKGKCPAPAITRKRPSGKAPAYARATD
jgi:hypothetical protein